MRPEVSTPTLKGRERLMSDAAAATTDPTATPPTQVQRLAAEGLGAAVLVFLGLGGGLNGLAFGVTLFALLIAFGRISGGHFNPAVSVGAAMAGRLSWKDAGLYSAAQVAGGIAGGIGVLLVALSSGGGYDFGEPLGAPGVGDQGQIDLGGALLLELVVATIFVLLVLAITDKRSDNTVLAPLAIGLAFAGVGYVLLGATGSVANPAVALSTVFFSGGDAILQAWLFVLVPLVGAAAAGLLHPAIFGRDADPVPGSGLNLSSGSSAPAQGGYAGQWNQQAYGQLFYAQPGQQSHSQEQPIIQDGWQWDPQAQQWIPAQQQAPVQPAAPQQQTGQGWAQQSGETDGRTQVRPPE